MRSPVLKRAIIFNIGEPIFFEKYYGKENDDTVLREITDKIMTKIGMLTGQKYRY
jgi:hypothetical protein